MSPQPLGTPQDEQAIQNLALEFAAGWNRHDAQGMAACFTMDGDLVNPSGKIARGRAHVQKLFAEEQAGPLQASRVTMAHKHLRFLKPDLAMGDYQFEVSHIRNAEGQETTTKGLVSCVLRKEGDGWLITAARTNVPAPMPAANQ